MSEYESALWLTDGRDGDRGDTATASGGARTLSADAPIETGDIGAIRAPVDADAGAEGEADEGAGTEDVMLVADANAGAFVAKCAAGDVGADACAEKGERGGDTTREGDARTENWSA